MDKMPVKEAIEILKTEADYLFGNDKPYDREAFEMAISALSETKKKGQWIRFKNIENGYYHIKCSKCGQYWSIDDHAEIFKYCFNCGADMRKNNC